MTPSAHPEPPPVSSTGPRDESSFTAEDEENAGIDGRLLEREMQRVDGVTSILRVIVKNMKVSPIYYSLRLPSIDTKVIRIKE